MHHERIRVLSERDIRPTHTIKPLEAMRNHVIDGVDVDSHFVCVADRCFTSSSNETEAWGLSPAGRLYFSGNLRSNLSLHAAAAACDLEATAPLIAAFHSKHH